MAVKLRMARMGRRHRPFFRINAVESHTPRDGRVLEKLGHYDPLEKDVTKQIILKRERVEFWLGQGAVPSDTVSEILLRQGIKHKYAEEKAARHGAGPETRPRQRQALHCHRENPRGEEESRRGGRGCAAAAAAAAAAAPAEAKPETPAAGS